MSGSARAHALFTEALELDGEARGAFRARLRDEEPKLAAEVDALFRADAEAGDFLGSPASLPASLLESFATTIPPGTLVGPYRVLRKVGQGGMGAVYLAERADGHFEQQVAIKLLRHRWDTTEMLRRFRRERQILAGLAHPKIARLLDGGALDDGQPFLAMEYIEGLPITEWCDGNRSTVRERVALLRSVCDAVQHAHRNLVVHGDLKPDNVLIGRDGAPTLLDFGIAHVLAPDEGDEEGAAEAFRPLSPAYASPEQLRGQAITTQTDVYALGLLLYELLTGTNPHAGVPGSLDELEAWILAHDAPPPSRAWEAVPSSAPSSGAKGGPAPPGLPQAGDLRGTSPGGLRRALRGDLDRITLRALEKDPDRRYSSVERFAEDLRRYLEGFPVEAAGHGTGYRARKFVRRHRESVAAAVGAMLLLLTAFGTAVWQGQRAADERDRARVEAETAERVTDFLVTLFGAAEPSSVPGSEVSVREVLDRGAAEVVSGLDGQPAVQAAVASAIGRTYRRLGLYPEAQEFLERALDLRQPDPATPSGELASNLNALAMLRHHTGEYEEAEALYRQALPLAVDASRGAPSALEAGIRNNLGTLYFTVGRTEEAQPMLREGLEMRRAVFGEEHEHVAASMINVARAMNASGEGEAARDLVRRGIEMRRAVMGSEDPYVAQGLRFLAGMHLDVGELDEAQGLLEEALVVYRRSVGDEHPYLGGVVLALGEVHEMRGELGAAEERFREGLERFRRAYPSRHPNVGRAALSLGLVLRERGEAEGVAELLGEGVSILREAFPPDHPEVLAAEIRLAR